MKTGIYKTLPLRDFGGKDFVWLENVAQVRMAAVKALLMLQGGAQRFGLKAMEDEISSTLTIENIDFSRDSVRKILKGYAPSDESENRIFGLKKGPEFISDTRNSITEQNIHTLYQLAIGDFIENDYHRLESSLPDIRSTAAFQSALATGQITEKEKDLWYFVLSAYGDGEFSTKQLEKDFGNAAYATICSFVLKFERLGLLTGQKYGNKMKYRA